MKVAILGASQNPDRYSYKAFRMLQDYGHSVVPIHPALDEIEKTPVKHKLSEIEEGSIDTLTVYVNPEISSTLRGDIFKLRPSRVIFNPGSENTQLMNELREKGIRVVEACTLVLLRTRQFDTA